MGATFDFGDGPVPARRHKNLDGSEGGWVADSATIGEGAAIGEGATARGTWNESPLYVIGSQHIVCVPEPGRLRIDCCELSFAEWAERGERIGAAEGYTPEQIAEYRLYLELAKRRYQPQPTKVCS